MIKVVESEATLAMCIINGIKQERFSG